MKVYIYPDYRSLSKKGAEIVLHQLLLKPHSVLGLATGSSPVGLYEELRVRAVDFSLVTTFNLDEYIGVDRSHEASYRFFMERHLFSKVNMKMDRIHIPNGKAEDFEKECQEYEKRIEKAGGIDLQVLGIGVNGHIGFNEPGTPFDQKTHVATLTESTRKANERFFTSIEEVPTHAISMGVKSIMHAKRILLLASGQEKALAVKEAIEGPVTVQMPASVLQLHPDVTFLLDEQAASRLDTTRLKEAL